MLDFCPFWIYPCWVCAFGFVPGSGLLGFVLVGFVPIGFALDSGLLGFCPCGFVSGSGLLVFVPVGSGLLGFCPCGFFPDSGLLGFVPVGLSVLGLCLWVCPWFWAVGCVPVGLSVVLGCCLCPCGFVPGSGLLFCVPVGLSPALTHPLSPGLPAGVAAPAQALHAEHGLELLQEDQPRVEAAGTDRAALQGFPDIPQDRTPRNGGEEQLGGRARPSSGCELLLPGVPQEQSHWFGFRLATKHKKPGMCIEETPFYTYFNRYYLDRLWSQAPT